MDQHNIDRLFREKLGGKEVTPSPKAWSEVEKQIGGNKKPVIYWVAASVSLLIISWFAWPEHQANFTGIASQEINHPVLIENPEMEAPVAIDLTDKKNTITSLAKANGTIKAQPTQFVAADPKASEEIKEEDNLPMEIDKKSMVAIEEIEILPSEELEKVPESIETEKASIGAVKITYIASNDSKVESKEPKSDSTGVLKKFLAFTDKLDPGEMLADIKTAKDNLINSGLKNKKERSTMTP